MHFRFSDTKYKIAVIIICLSLFSCRETFDYSPYAIHFGEEDKNIHAKNLIRLGATKTNDTITIAFTGDTHRFYDDLDDFTKSVNADSSIDFVIHVGDIADFGLPKQFEWSHSLLRKLHVPYFVVIGNHDLVGNGLRAYEEMFGQLNFSFIFDSTKFIFINTNSREFEFNGKVPDINWLDNELKPQSDFKTAIIVFHVPPYDNDFDPPLARPFYDCLSHYSHVMFSVHGHLHHHEVIFPDTASPPLINVYGVEHRKYNVIKIFNNDYRIETRRF